MIELYKTNERIAKETEQKEFKKYIAFFWQKKKIENENKEKRKKQNNKLQEKAERIEELEKNNDKKKKELIKKMQAMEAKKERFDTEKREKYEKEKLERKKKFDECQQNKQILKEEDNLKIQDILDFQYMSLQRVKTRDNTNDKKRIQASEKTVLNQMILEKNLTFFNRRMNELKDKSIYKKTPEQRFKMYRDVKKEEARKKKEEEEKLLNKQ